MSEHDADPIDTLARWIWRAIVAVIVMFLVAIHFDVHWRYSTRNAKAAGDRAKIMHGPPQMWEVRP